MFAHTSQFSPLLWPLSFHPLSTADVIYVCFKPALSIHSHRLFIYRKMHTAGCIGFLLLIAFRLRYLLSRKRRNNFLIPASIIHVEGLSPVALLFTFLYGISYLQRSVCYYCNARFELVPISTFSRVCLLCVHLVLSKSVKVRGFNP